MGSLFGGGEDPPKTPKPADTQGAMERTEEMLAEQRRRRMMAGRASTMLSGVTGPANTATRTITGKL